MDWQAALLARIIAHAAVIDVAATYNGRKAVFWGRRPQGSDMPGATLNIITDPRPQHLKGFDGFRKTRVQADTYAPDFGRSLALARGIISAVVSPGIFSGVRFGRAMIEGPRGLGAGGLSMEDDQNGQPVNRQSVDLILWHEGD